MPAEKERKKKWSRRSCRVCTKAQSCRDHLAAARAPSMIIVEIGFSSSIRLSQMLLTSRE